jgi:2-oxo-4-hydroxy-4-carboxy-5-ureidoimidazoline decarboxylase
VSGEAAADDAIGGDPSALRSALLECLAVPRWADDVAALAPFDDVDSLVAAALAAATPLSADDIGHAMAAHPRIGERRAGDTAEARFSHAEQAASADPDATLAALLAEGNQAYEWRFDRVFLIRAAGRSRPEILTQLIRRLANEDAQELAEVGAQLREITELRLRQRFAAPEPSAPEPSVGDITLGTEETTEP